MAGKRASPGVGRGIGDNSGLPSHNDVRAALAIEMIFAEKEKKLREEKKRARKKIEGMGIPLSALSFLKEAQDMTASELEQHFRMNWHLAGAIHSDVHEQLDIFAPKPSAPERRAAHYTMGLLQGLKGAELEVPPMVAGDDRQQMIDGHNEGMARRKAAWDALAQGDEVVDGTGKKPSGKAAKVGEEAAKDFAKDQGEDPLVVNGERYANMRQANAARARLAAQQPPAGDQEEGGESPQPEGPNPPSTATESSGPISEPQPTTITDGSTTTSPTESPSETDSTAAPSGAGETGGSFLDSSQPVVGDDFKPPRQVARPDFHSWSDNWEEWTASQCMEFRRWFEGLPEGNIPAISHQGAVAYFNLLREEKANRDSAGPDDGFEMTDEERAAQTSRPSVQEAETDLDPETIAAKAKELEANGFVPPKSSRKRRTPAV